MNQNPQARKGILFDIFSNWLDVDNPKEIMDDVQNHKVLNLSFQYLHDVQETDQATRCLLQTINSVKLLENHRLF